MDLSGTSSIPIHSIPFPTTQQIPSQAETSLFQNCMDEFQFQADLLKHLKGVPLDAISIAPNIWKKMKENPSAYRYYMEKLDGFVGEYQKYHQPGSLELSFFIQEDGQYCTRAENMFLKRLCEGSDEPTPRKDGTNATVWLGVPLYAQSLDLQMSSLYPLGVYPMGQGRLKWFDGTKSMEEL